MGGIGRETATRRVAAAAARAGERAPFLRVPPFPGSLPHVLGRPATAAVSRVSDEEADGLLQAIRRHKVGGTYWAAQPPLPNERYTLVCVSDEETRSSIVHSLADGGPVLCWVQSPARDLSERVRLVSGPCDPWHLLDRAAELVVDEDEELALLAGIAGVPVRWIGRRTGHESGSGKALRDLLRELVVEHFDYVDPFSGDPIGPAEAIALCGFWRKLIDANRDIRSAVGFARWKRTTVEPLLWSGSGHVPFDSPADRSQGKIAIWKSRAPAHLLAELENSGAKLLEVEDGFIRSAGLGADCVPPLSIVVDRLGIYFDPSRPSDLERLLEQGEFPDELLERARQLRELIVASGLSKYEARTLRLERRVAGRPHVLVPGQVEDDRSVLSGGGAVTTNLELLRRARQHAPGAYILYKPHPDVEAGHRVGAIPDDLCLTVADEVVRDQPISALIDLVDEVHVNTSLAGFEALLRGKKVVTHGVPFYAGWGLTQDLGSIPARRTAVRTLDELVAAALLLYPRYLDPITRLPCPPEVLVRRLAEGAGTNGEGLLVSLRRLQGRGKRALARLRPW